MRNLIRAQRAAAAGMIRPAEHAGLEEGAVDDQLPAALEQIDQVYFAIGPVELVLLLHRHPRHAPALGSHGVTGVHHGLLLHEKLLPRSLPLLLRYDRGCLHREMRLYAFHFSHFARCHPISPLSPERDDSP
jgi:hypothetical protein